MVSRYIFGFNAVRNLKETKFQGPDRTPLSRPLPGKQILKRYLESIYLTLRDDKPAALYLISFRGGNPKFRDVIKREWMGVSK